MKALMDWIEWGYIQIIERSWPDWHNFCCKSYFYFKLFQFFFFHTFWKLTISNRIKRSSKLKCYSRKGACIFYQLSFIFWDLLHPPSLFSFGLKKILQWNENPPMQALKSQIVSKKNLFKLLFELFFKEKVKYLLTCIIPGELCLLFWEYLIDRKMISIQKCYREVLETKKKNLLLSTDSLLNSMINIVNTTRKCSFYCLATK